MIWVYALLAFLVGAAAGFQGICDRYRKDSGRAACTFWGIVYLISRGIIPSAAFVITVLSRSDPSRLWLYAIGCGLGTEALLRANFHFRSIETSGGTFQEVSKGFFDFLRWWQGFFLENIAGQLAAHRLRLVRGVVAGRTNFLELVRTFEQNAGAWPNRPALGDLKEKIGAPVIEYSARRAKGENSNLDESFCHKLCYIILNELGEKALKTLLNPLER